MRKQQKITILQRRYGLTSRQAEWLAAWHFEGRA